MLITFSLYKNALDQQHPCVNYAVNFTDLYYCVLLFYEVNVDDVC